jgi:hypothetical protein
VKLADSCEKFEKAFKSSTYGKVLGTFFDSEKMAWKTPTEKRQKYLNCIKKASSEEKISLEDMQSLMGCLNHAGQLSYFMTGFKHNLNQCLGKLQTNPDSKIELSENAREELRIWQNFLLDDDWHPLTGAYCGTPLACMEFASDAAGHGNAQQAEGRIGCGNVGFNHIGEIIFAYQLWWPSGVLDRKTDSKGKRFGAKTTTLEFLGIMIPFLTIPHMLAGKHIIVRVDNSGCFYGWLNKSSAKDETASILIRALHLISAYLQCQVHIRHLPRLSNWEAMLVDRLSREETTTHADKRLLRSFPRYRIPDALTGWMKNPSEELLK